MKNKNKISKPIYDKNAKDLFLRNLVANWDLFIWVKIFLEVWFPAMVKEMIRKKTRPTQSSRNQVSGNFLLDWKVTQCQGCHLDKKVLQGKPSKPQIATPYNNTISSNKQATRINKESQNPNPGQQAAGTHIGLVRKYHLLPGEEGGGGIINTIKSAIPQRQTDEWCWITCRPGSANYFKHKILKADWSQPRRWWAW